MLFLRRQKGPRLKSPRELDAMREAGRLASRCLQEILEYVRPGVSTQDLDDLQMAFCEQHQCKPAPLGYRGFPKAICTSINEVICHGIPNPEQKLVEGDIITVDVTLIVDGFHGDNASTAAVGPISKGKRRLMETALEALRLGIEAVRPGGHIGDVGFAIQRYVEPRGYSVVRDFVGHGLGRRFHEEPLVPHYGKRGDGTLLQPGMTFTIEPMVNEGTYRAVVLDDGWTAITADRKLSCQYEHTVAVTSDGVEILTCQNGRGTWEIPGRAEQP